MKNSQTTSPEQSSAKSVAKHLFSILITDDDQHLASMLNRILTDAGYTCTCVFNAEEALELCGSKPFDLIITDIHMPGMSGVEFAEAVQALAVNAMIIFMTANAEIMTISRAMTLEPFGYLEKPFKNTKLIELVAKAYERFCEQVADVSEKAKLSSVIQKKERELRHETEQRLANEELLEGIISNASFGVVAVDHQLTVSLVNTKAFELFAQPLKDRSHFVGSSLISLLPDGCRPQLLALCQAAIRSLQPQKRTFTNPLNRRLLEASSYPILRNNKLQAAVLIIQDISDRETPQSSL